jgi:hypothetical protein
MRQKKNVSSVLVGKPEGKDHLEDQSTDGRIKLKCMLKKWWKGVDWIHLDQASDQRQTVANMEKSLQAPHNAEKFPVYIC